MAPPTPEDYTLPFDGSIFAPLSSDTRRKYSEAWALYAGLAPLIAEINAIIEKPVKTEEEAKVRQYQFASYDERRQFLLGRDLHVAAYSDIDWC